MKILVAFIRRYSFQQNCGLWCFPCVCESRSWLIPRRNQIMGGNSPSSSRRKHCCGGLAVATDISWNFSESEMTVRKMMNALHDCPSDSTVITGWPISLVTTSCWLCSDNFGSWWAASVATYYPSRITEHLKSKSTGGCYQRDGSPCIGCYFPTGEMRELRPSC